jgi:hypothetical protein
MTATNPIPLRKRASANEATETTRGVKRYSLVLPEDLFEEIQHLAEKRQTTVVDLIRRFIKLGLLAAQVEETPGAAFIIREGDTEREIIFL